MSYSNIFKLNDTIQCGDDYYIILKKLGNGGSGSAYLCLCNTGINQGCYFVAKIFYQIDKLDRLKRFEKEIEFLSKTNHPSIIKFYGKGEHTIKGNNYPFYIMEYMPNSLQNELRAGAIGIEKTFLYTTQLLAALTYMKKHNIIHRDIKPENIFINGRRAILGDFGLIKDISESENVDSDIEDLKGTVCADVSENGDAMPFMYRTPQLVRYMNTKEPLTYKSDVFQLGITVAMMLTGKNPIKKPNDKSDEVKLVADLNEFLVDIKETTFGNRIVGIVVNMLNLNEDSIKDPEYILQRSINAFRDFLMEKKKLEGKILR